MTHEIAAKFILWRSQFPFCQKKIEKHYYYKVDFIQNAEKWIYDQLGIQQNWFISNTYKDEDTINERKKRLQQIRVRFLIHNFKYKIKCPINIQTLHKNLKILWQV